MTLDQIITLAGIAVSMTWTPGPNNALLAASGANFGWRRTFPHAMGVAIGYPLMLFCVTLGLGQVFSAEPMIGTVLGWIGFAAILWFAWRIATADAVRNGGRSRPLSFVEACGFQWINPKAWTFAIWVSASHVDSANLWAEGGMAALIFLLSGLGSANVWTFFGVGIGRVLGTGWRLRAFNVSMAVLLVASGVWMMLG